MCIILLLDKGCTLDGLAYLCAFKFIYEVIIGYKWPLEWIMFSRHEKENHKSQSEEFWLGLILIIQIKNLISNKILKFISQSQ